MVKSILTQSFIDEFKAVGRQKYLDDPIVVCKLHIPGKARMLLLCDYSERDDEYFGILHEGENVGYYDFLPCHFEDMEKEAGMSIERDTLFKPTKVSEL